MVQTFNVRVIDCGEPDDIGINKEAKLLVFDGGIEIRGLETDSEEFRYVFPEESIVNVLKDRDLIFFQIKNAEEFLSCCLKTHDEPDAVRIKDLLPKTVTHEVSDEIVHLKQFREILFNATPNAFVSRYLVNSLYVVFTMMVLSGVGLFSPSVDRLIDWGANVGYLTTSGQWWRLLSCVFIHIGLIHLLFNSWVLNAIGPLVERLYGNAAFFIIFLFSGLCGSLNSLYWNQNVISAGASGAIFGISGALLSYIFVYRNTIPKDVFRDLKASYLTFVIFNLVFGAAITGIDNAAHIGGLLGGLLMGYFLAMPLEPEARIGKLRNTIAKGIAVSLVVIFLLWPAIPKHTGEFQKILKWYVKEEKVAIRNFKEQIERIGKIPGNEKQIAFDIESLCLSRWEKIVTRLSTVEIPENSVVRRRWSLVLKFAKLQRDSMKSIIRGLRHSDMESLEKFRNYQQQARKLVRMMNSVVTK